MFGLNVILVVSGGSLPRFSQQGAAYHGLTDSLEATGPDQTALRSVQMWPIGKPVISAASIQEGDL